jgi:hypothetical protein
LSVDGVRMVEALLAADASGDTMMTLGPI